MCGTAVAGVCRARGWFPVAAIWLPSLGGALPLMIRHSIGFEVAKVTLYTEVEGKTKEHNDTSVENEDSCVGHECVYESHSVPCYETVPVPEDSEEYTEGISVGGTLACAKRSYVPPV